MSAKQKAPSTIIKELETKIATLEKELAETKTMKEYYSRQHTELSMIVEGIHDALDDLGIKRYRDENKYNTIPLHVRLLSWAMKLAEQKK